MFLYCLNKSNFFVFKIFWSLFFLWNWGNYYEIELFIGFEGISVNYIIMVNYIIIYIVVILVNILVRKKKKIRIFYMMWKFVFLFEMNGDFDGKIYGSFFDVCFLFVNMGM